jgi:hypothetical protein
MSENQTKTRVKVNFEVDIPVDGCQLQAIEDWLRFSFGDTGSISKNNPLYSYEAEPTIGSFRVSGCDENRNKTK